MPCDAALMVDAAPNGDIVVACPDGAARVFSSDVDRQLPAPEIRTYKEMVTAALVKMGEEAQGGAAGGDGGMVGDLDTENMKGQCALMLITRHITHHIISHRNIFKTFQHSKYSNTSKGPEALEQPGKENGQILMVKKGGKVEAHEWSAETGKWTLIGIVHDAQDEKPPPGWQYVSAYLSFQKKGKLDEKREKASFNFLNLLFIILSYHQVL